MSIFIPVVLYTGCEDNGAVDSLFVEPTPPVTELEEPTPEATPTPTPETEEEVVNAVAFIFDSTIFTESTSNDGSIAAPIQIFILNDVLNAEVNDNLIADSKAEVDNVPAGLTAKLIVTSEKTVSFVLEGVATDHSQSADIKNLSVKFLDSSLKENQDLSTIETSVKSNIVVDFLNPYSLSYDRTQMLENSANDGGIGTVINITVIADDVQFTGTNGENFVSNSKATVTSLPAGMGAIITKVSDTRCTLQITGNASSHAIGDSISNLSVEFDDSAFSNADASLISNTSRNDVELLFFDAATIVYGATSLSEAVSNIGAITQTLTITLVGDTFDGTNGEDFANTGKLSVSGVPAGLDLEANRTSATEITVSLTGAASAHEDSNDVSNLTLTFQDSAFDRAISASLVGGYQKNDLVIDFRDAYTLTYSGSSLNEAAANNGAVTDTLTLTLVGTSFTGMDASDFVAGSKATVTNLPTGLNGSLTKLNAQQLQLSLTSNATSHTNTADVSNVTVTLLDSAFASGNATGVTGAVKNDVSIDFRDPASLSWAGTGFNEDAANVGTITDNILVTLSNSTFSGSPGEDFVASGKVIVANVPSGLTARAVMSNSTNVVLSFSGVADQHETAHDIANYSVTFQDSAFSGDSAANVVDFSQTNLTLGFIDAYRVSYSTERLTEAAANDGSVTDTNILTLTGTTFAGTNGENFVASGKATISNLPPGLTAVVNRDSSTQLTMSFTNNASTHLSTNSVNDLEINLANSAFSFAQASAVVGSSKEDINIEFYDPAGATITLRQDLNGYSGATDNWIQSNSTSNTNGDSNTIRMRHDHDNEADRLVGLLRWTLPTGLVPASAIVKRVRMRLYKLSNNGGGTPCLFAIQRMRRSWSENNSSWNEYDTGNAWETVGALGANDSDSEVIGIMYVGTGNNQYYEAELNPTGVSYVQEWINDGTQNYGFRLESNYYEYSECGAEFSSRDEATETERPELVIDYTTPVDGKLGWRAFHDLHPNFTTTAPNATRGYGDLQSSVSALAGGASFTGTSTSQHLVDYDSSLTVPAKIHFSVSGAINENSGGAAPSGGDGQSYFESLIDMTGGYFTSTNSSQTLDVVVSNLPADTTYNITAYSNHGSDATRLTDYTLQNVSSFLAKSSSGVSLSTTSLTNDTATLNGDNTSNGYVARWENISPSGTSFMLHSEANAGTVGNAILPQAVLIQQSDLMIVTDQESYTFAENGIGTINVKLSRDPGVAVTVNSSLFETDTRWYILEDTGITISAGSSLTFNSGNWNTYQPITIALADDAETYNKRRTLKLTPTVEGIAHKELEITKTTNESPDLLVELLFEGNANDTSGNNQHATLAGSSGASLATIATEGGSRGDVLVIDADQDKAVIPQAAISSVTTEMSIITWLYVDSASTNNCTLFGKIRYGRDWGLRTDGSHLQFRLRNSGSQTDKDTADIPFDQWFQIAITIDTQQIRVYQNGVHILSTPDGAPSAGNIDDTGGYDVFVGNGETSSNHHRCRGKVDNFRIYRGVVHENVIQSMYQSEQ